MASQELRAFLSSIDSRYVDHADAIHKGEFTNPAEIAAADCTDLEKLGIPKGAAGLIIAAAGGRGDSFVAFIFQHQPCYMACTSSSEHLRSYSTSCAAASCFRAHLDPQFCLGDCCLHPRARSICIHVNRCSVGKCKTASTGYTQLD